MTTRTPAIRQTVGEARGVDLDALEALAKAAAPSPWESQRTEDLSPNALVYGPDGDSFAYLSWNPGNDYDMVSTAAYVAAVSPDVVLALIAELRAARAGRVEMGRRYDDLRWCNKPDLCDIKAEGVALALDDYDSESAALRAAADGSAS